VDSYGTVFFANCSG